MKTAIFCLSVCYIPMHFMDLQLKQFLPCVSVVYLHYRTVHLDIFLSYGVINFQGFLLFCHFKWIRKFFEWSYGFLLRLCLFPIATYKHSGPSKT